jgi:hypothetical protein
MNPTRLNRRLPVFVGAVAITAMGVITTACGGGSNGPASTTTTTTTTGTTATTTPPPPISTTENNVNPTGGNLFTPNPISMQPEPSQNPHGREDPAHR